MENPEALGFHQETTKESRQRTETMENLTEILGLVLYQTLHYFFGTKIYIIFYLCDFRNVKQLNNI